MPLSSLPSEILSLIVQDLGKADWKRLVLVSKDFRDTTRRFLWQSLYINSLKKFEFLMNLFENEIQLGGSVKSLSMDFSRDFFLVLKSISDAPPKKKFSSITKDQFLSFIRFLPSLEKLSFQEAPFPPFTPLEVAEPLFPLVHTLTYYMRVDIVSNTLSSLLQMAPNVTTLDFYTKVNEQTAQLSISSPLKSLTCSLKPYFPLTDESFIPQSSIRSLQLLEIIPNGDLNHSQIQNLVDTIRLCSSTLLEIDYLSQILNFEPFLPALAGLKVLEILKLKFYELPIDVFQLLPITLKVFSSYVSAKHLKHLHLYPRPLLALQELEFETLDAETIQYLPDSVERIYVGSDEDFVGRVEINLHELLEWIGKRGRKNLTEICIYQYSDKGDNWIVIANFKRMGIDLSIDEWT